MYRYKLDSKEDTLAKSITLKNLYMTLATTDGHKPWAATVVYVVDPQFILYFMSGLGSLHAKHIATNPHVAITITDYDPPNGVQIDGLACLLDEREYPRVTDLLYRRKYPGADAEEPKPEYLQSEAVLASPRRLFKVKPVEVYLWDKEYWDTDRVDRRVEVKLTP